MKEKYILQLLLLSVTKELILFYLISRNRSMYRKSIRSYNSYWKRKIREYGGRDWQHSRTSKAGSMWVLLIFSTKLSPINILIRSFQIDWWKVVDTTKDRLGWRARVSWYSQRLSGNRRPAVRSRIWSTQRLVSLCNHRRESDVLELFFLLFTVNRRTIYLMMYNAYQFVCFLYIFVMLLVMYNRDGYYETIKNTYPVLGVTMKSCQLLQYLEVLHAMVGYTKGSPLFPFMQVTGRNFILFLMINAEARMQDKPLVFYLFFIWSLVECVRYPYYLAVLLKKEYRWLTWLRYTIWIPLYPLGTMVEGIIVLRNLPYFDETKRFTIEMPNKWNFTFDMVGFMKFYMTLVLLPGLVMVMRHLSKLRAKKLRTPKIYSVPKKAD